MPADDRERGAPDSETRGAGLAAVLDRLWEDLRDEDDTAGGNDTADGDGSEIDGDELPAAVIDAVVEPPTGADQAAVEEAVAAAEDHGDSNRERDDDLSI
ncbi:MAG: hypothetical protein ABEJ94_08095 [Halorientalis sp.]